MIPKTAPEAVNVPSAYPSAPGLASLKNDLTLGGPLLILVFSMNPLVSRVAPGGCSFSFIDWSLLDANDDSD